MFQSEGAQPGCLHREFSQLSHALTEHAAISEDPCQFHPAAQAAGSGSDGSGDGAAVSVQERTVGAEQLPPQPAADESVEVRAMNLTRMGTGTVVTCGCDQVWSSDQTRCHTLNAFLPGEPRG